MMRRESVQKSQARSSEFKILQCDRMFSEWLNFSETR